VKKMNDKAYEILKEANLPHSKVYTFDEIFEFKHNEMFFVRWRGDSGISSGIASVEEIRKLYKDNKREKILGIEKVYICEAGCTVLKRKDLIYIEYIEGHLSALLRKGLCRKRVAIQNGSICNELDVRQEWICTNTENFFLWNVFNGKISNNYKIALECVLDIKNELKDDVLFEVMFTKQKPIFCDAKFLDKKDYNPIYKNLFRNGLHNIREKNSEGEITQIDHFNVDYPSHCMNMEKKNIIVHEGAITSHFITKNFNVFSSLKKI